MNLKTVSVGVLAAATATQIANADTKGKILVIASSATELVMQDQSKKEVGFFLNELAVPAEFLADKGYEIILATPNGEFPNMDKGSNRAVFFNNDEKLREKAFNFVNNLPVISLNDAITKQDQFAGIFIPGGHAPMADLATDKELGKLLKYFHESNKPTAAICHGPVALLAALDESEIFVKSLINSDPKLAMQNANNWIYEGYRMTMLSDAEEWVGEASSNKYMPYHIEQALQMSGANIDNETMYQSHVIRYNELITGQNPASDIALAQLFLNALEEQN